MQDIFDKWLLAVLGNPIEAEDPSNKDQCMDLAFHWLDTLKIPRDTIRHLYAYQVWTEASDVTKQYFDLIPNTPDAIPQVGDLIVFNTIVGPSGHICVATGKGDTKTFHSIDQNWNGHLYAEEVVHNYNGCFGFLRSKNVTDPLTECLTQHATLVNLCNQKDETIKQLTTQNDQIPSLQGKIADLEGQVTDLTNVNTGLKTNISEVQKHNADLLLQMQDMAKSDSTAIDEGLAAEKNYTSLLGEVKKLAQSLGVEPTIPSITEKYTNLDAQLQAANKAKTEQLSSFNKFFQTFLSVFFKGGKK